MSKREARRSIEPLRQIKGLTRAKATPYSAFDAIDGQHPYQKTVPNGFVLYPVKRLTQGRVLYFNFALAKEMGLIADNHPQQLTPALEAKLIETFSLQIVNEYDQMYRAKPAAHMMKAYPYMATRYLQLQHRDKRGSTSGDGRSIWNGIVTNKGMVWDISSRGTGVTRLAPGAVEAQKPLKTGGAEFGYGCGMADIDELYGSALMSEIFHLNGVATERVLTIIDLGRGVGVGVRAAPNLIRPAHLFLFLKQEKLDDLKKATDYFIDRQSRNGSWKIDPAMPEKYDRLLSEVTVRFAQFAAALERNYVFAWMDWDGDNVLADAGIIDYGSIRQFGLRHDQYRYDDVERFSTTLNEQRGKARLTVQVFAQMVDYLKTGKRRRLEDFAGHKNLREFDSAFDKQLRKIFLMQTGYDEVQAEQLMSAKSRLVEEYYEAFSILERTKTKGKTKRLPDGINKPAVFNMRAVLRDFPGILRNRSADVPPGLPLTYDEFLNLMVSEHAKRYDTRMDRRLRAAIDAFQTTYMKVLVAVNPATDAKFLRVLSDRAQRANFAGRLTGNSIEFLVAEILKHRKRGLSVAECQQALDLFVAQQTPAVERRPYRSTKPASLNSAVGRLYQALVQIAFDFQEDI